MFPGARHFDKDAVQRPGSLSGTDLSSNCLSYTSDSLTVILPDNEQAVLEAELVGGTASPLPKYVFHLIRLRISWCFGMGKFPDVGTPSSGRRYVLLVGLFAALGGFLFGREPRRSPEGAAAHQPRRRGLDLGYISGVESMASFSDDVLHGESMRPITTGRLETLDSCRTALHCRQTDR